MGVRFAVPALRESALERQGLERRRFFAHLVLREGRGRSPPCPLRGLWPWHQAQAFRLASFLFVGNPCGSQKQTHTSALVHNPYFKTLILLRFIGPPRPKLSRRDTRGGRPPS